LQCDKTFFTKHIALSGKFEAGEDLKVAPPLPTWMPAKIFHRSTMLKRYNTEVWIGRIGEVDGTNRRFGHHAAKSADFAEGGAG